MDEHQIKSDRLQAYSPIDAVLDMSDGLQIDTLSPLDHFVVRTRNSSYDVIVASGREGKVVVRGGRFFPEFQRAQLVGATGGGHLVKLLGVYVGLCLELFADGRCVVTSPVVDILRTPIAATFQTH